MMTPFPPKLIAARRCAHWRTRARVRVGSLRFARFGFPPTGARARVEASTLSTFAATEARRPLAPPVRHLLGLPDLALLVEMRLVAERHADDRRRHAGDQHRRMP